MTKVKICGITCRHDIELMNRYHPDYAGFVFFEKSRRNLTLNEAVQLKSGLREDIRSVAVCVSPDHRQLKEFEEAGFDIIQIHGTFQADTYQGIGVPFWRAINLSADAGQLQQTASDRLAGYVVDGSRYGGGKTFDWNKNREGIRSFLQQQGPDLEFILAGGLNPENVQEGIRIFEPDTVDVSSGVEGESGKDEKKVAAFLRAVRTMP